MRETRPPNPPRSQIHADANSGEARHAARLAEHLGAIADRREQQQAAYGEDFKDKDDVEHEKEETQDSQIVSDNDLSSVVDEMGDFFD